MFDISIIAEPRLNRGKSGFNWVNRKGAKDAKGVFCWFVLILEEGPQDQNTPSPDGRHVGLLSFFKNNGKTIEERVAVLLIPEDASSFYSPGHDVLEKARRLPAISCASGAGRQASSLGWRGISMLMLYG